MHNVFPKCYCMKNRKSEGHPRSFFIIGNEGTIF